MIKNKVCEKKTLNIGMSILRSLLCYWVLIIHLSMIKRKHLKYVCRHFHVPTFFLLSFYFFYPILRNKNEIKLKLRFQRLLYPYVSWSLIIWIFQNTLTILKMLGKKKIITFERFIYTNINRSSLL